MLIVKGMPEMWLKVGKNNLINSMETIMAKELIMNVSRKN